MDMRRQVPALRAARRAAEVEDLIQPVIDALSANVAILSLDASICAVNAAWRAFAELNGCQSRACCVGMNYLDVCRQAAHACPEAKVTADALQSVIAGTTPSSSHPYTLLLGDGLHHFKLLISRIALPHWDCVVVSHEDVTAVVRLEEERRTHAAELVEAQDRERRQIARELHDSTAQHLTAISLLSKIMVDRSHSDEIDPLLEELRGVVAQAQSEIRTLSYLLHPPLLAEVGLEVSLRRYIDGFSKRTGVAIAFHWGLAPGDVLGGDVAFAILRVAQEALANVHRHSGAKSAAVHIEAAAREVRVTISDPGVGIGQAAEDGLGIPGMRARAAELGGTFGISQDGRGTSLLAVFPRGNGPDAGTGTEPSV
jgi:signal transduction histidine kinase